jgi:hypothetical protein
MDTPLARMALPRGGSLRVGLDDDATRTVWEVLSMKGTHGKAHRFCRVFLFVAVIFLPPALDVRADVSAQDREVLEAVDQVAPTVEEIARILWDLSEVSLLETRSSVYLKDLLKNNGFTITSEGTAGVPTAFIAEYGTGEPKIGIMLEYDALPGLGNEPVPKKQLRKDGVTAGHGCGHNLVGAASKVLALTGMDILTDEEFLKQTKADFDKRTEGFTYKSPIPDMIKEPSGLPDDMRSHGTRLELKETFIKDHSHDY